MTTWNTITIENPGALTLDTLPDALTADAEIWEGRDDNDERVTVPERTYFGGTFPEKPGDPDGSIVIAGGSKWQPEEAIAALIELSKTTGRITHHQSWDDEDGGKGTNVYENGAEVEALRLTSELVPDNLSALVAAVRRYVRRDERGDIYTEMGAEPMKAVMALVDALDPKGAKA